MFDVRDRLSCDEVPRNTIVAVVADMTDEEFEEFQQFLNEGDAKFFLETGNMTDEEIALAFGNPAEDELPF